ncbi:MAG: helix-turn-helix domain-containing protein [Planctomycetota bacterium]|nr:helix-turn-helix domain-containing protein [Planctomycetota bacterium]
MIAENAAAAVTPLLLSTRDAAQFLALGERTLWALTAPRGPIPCVRIGRAVRFDRRDLTRWVDGRKEQP